MSKLSYSVAEAAAATGLGEFQIRKAIKSGRLRTKLSEGSTDRKVGKILILRAALEDYLEKLADG